VVPVDSAPTLREAIGTPLSQQDILAAYVEQLKDIEPRGYLRQLCHFQGKWFPLYYFVRGLPKKEVIDLWRSEKGAYKNTVANLCSRLLRDERPPSASRGTALIKPTQFAQMAVPVPSEPGDFMEAMKCMRSLRPGEMNFKYLRSLIAAAMQACDMGPGDPLWSEIRYAATFLDYHEFGPGKTISPR
jgi:hypothetical protein